VCSSDLSVPVDLRLIALALGASKEQNILKILLPYRLPDILSGIVLAIGRAAEDTAVIMMTGAVVSAGTIRSVFDQFEALPYFIYYIAAQYSNPSELQAGFGAAILLLAICAFLFLGAYLLEHVVAHRLRR
jgi:phosphate transport system permease protein